MWQVCIEVFNPQVLPNAHQVTSKSEDMLQIMFEIIFPEKGAWKPHEQRAFEASSFSVHDMQL